MWYVLFLCYLPRFWTKISASGTSASIPNAMKANRNVFVVLEESEKKDIEKYLDSNVSFWKQCLDESQTST